MTRLHTVTFGPTDTKPLVFLGSLGSTVKMWLPQLDHFAATRTVTAIDLPGHGNSDTIAEPTLAELADAVLATLQAEKVDLVGLSLGGAIAQRIALDHPDRVDHLVLVSTAAKFGASESWIQKAVDVRAGKLDELSHGTLERWFSPTWREAHPASLEYWRRMVADADPVGYAAACTALSTFDTQAELAQLRVPTLVVAGTEDTSTPPEVVRELADAILGARYEELSPAAHLLNIEQADRFNARLEGFLR